jgi:hypothetical protein
LIEEAVGGDGPRVYLTFNDSESSGDGSNSNNKTPLPSRAPQPRMGNQEIDIDQLIAKLLEIPNEELLDSFLNLSPSRMHTEENDRHDHHRFNSSSVDID